MRDRRVLLGVSGSIACYKACEVASALVQEGAKVRTVMTANAMRFVAPLTFEALTGEPAATSQFPEGGYPGNLHIDLARWAEIVAIVPATANIIGKLACGVADDLLSTLAMATTAPLLIAPAMNEKLFLNPILQGNLRKLESLGARVVPPASGFLACGEVGVGRLAPPEAIVEEIALLVERTTEWAGRRVVVTAGRTEEPLDLVRYLSNRSSGKMGYALARAAARRGARVVLVTGPAALSSPPGVSTIAVRTGEEMLKAVEGALEGADCLLMAAAVCDFAPAEVEGGKIPRRGEGWSLALRPTEDILARVARRWSGRTFLVGFALEVDDLVARGRAKMEAKGVDVMVVNSAVEEGVGMEADSNRVTVLTRDGKEFPLPLLPKEEVAEKVCDILHPYLRPAKPF